MLYVLAIAFYSQPKEIINNFFSNRILIMLGKYSYAMYMIHLPLRAVIRDLFFGAEQFNIFFGIPLLGQFVFYILSTAISLFIAIVSWHIFEKHFLKLKINFKEHSWC